MNRQVDEAVHEGKKPFKCDICGAKFAVKQGLKNHVESVHEGKKPFKCDMWCLLCS